jgi:hypothetical protein
LETYSRSGLIFFSNIDIGLDVFREVKNVFAAEGNRACYFYIFVDDEYYDHEGSKIRSEKYVIEFRISCRAVSILKLDLVILIVSNEKSRAAVKLIRKM